MSTGQENRESSTPTSQSSSEALREIMERGGYPLSGAECPGLKVEVKATSAFVPVYSWWRHGGWYVNNVRYPSGAVGCVSRNFADKKWRIVCDPRPFDERPTFATRDEAARAEYALASGVRASEALKPDDNQTKAGA